MIASDRNRAGGGSSSGIYTLGCLLAVLLAGCSAPAPVAGPAAKSEAPVVAAPAASAAAEQSPAAPTVSPQAAEAAKPATRVAASPLATTPAGDAQRGLELYESRCGACHSIEANRVGPKHEGLFGRTAGKLKDYDYSTALKTSKIVWSEKTLDAWLKDPQALMPGQKMNYTVTVEKDRADIIAYLKMASSAK